MCVCEYIYIYIHPVLAHIPVTPSYFSCIVCFFGYSPFNPSNHLIPIDVYKYFDSYLPIHRSTRLSPHQTPASIHPPSTPPHTIQ